MPSEWITRWGYISEDAPPGRCGVTVHFPQTDPEGPVSDVTCWRETWGDFDQCIWHADTDEKPREELEEARTEYPERLDGIIIRGGNFGSSLSFANCSLNGAELTGVNLSMADISKAKLRFADLSESMFYRTSFTGAKLRGANLSEVNIQESDFVESNLIQADLSDAIAHRANFFEALMFASKCQGSDFRNCNFDEVDLRNVEFTEADLRFSSLENSNMRDTDLTDATAREAQFNGAMLENAIINRTDLRESNLTGADLYQAQFSNPRVNSETDFGDRCSYEKYDKSPEIADDFPPLEAATWVYRRLEDLHEENALADRTRAFHISKQEAQRKLDWQNGNYGRFTVGSLNRKLTNHGESLQSLLQAWAATILGAGILYPFVGGVSDNGVVYHIQIAAELPTIPGFLRAVEAVLRGIYFSVITFSTVGYANVAPHGIGSRILVGIESLVGAVLIALFVYVLGRRVAR